MAVQKVYLGVEMSQEVLKVALVDLERKHVIKIDIIPTSGNSINDASIYASVISSWMRSNLLPKAIEVAVAFPAYSGIMRLISIPKETEYAIDYVEWEFISATNLELKDYSLSSSFYPNPKKPERAIVAAVRKKMINDFCSAEVEKTGFKPSSLMPDVFVLHNLLDFSESLGSQPKCVLKADENFVVAFWGNETGPLSMRLLPGDCISSEAIVGILASGYKEFPKAKRNVKLCGELSANEEFVDELTDIANKQKESIDIQPWNSLSKFSFEKNGDFSKLSQCMGAIGATLGCSSET